MLETGPCLLPKIFEILLRARCHKFLLVSNIQSAFLNIRVKETDRNFLRFLWIDDIEKVNPNVVIKCFTSVCRLWFKLFAFFNECNRAKSYAKIFLFL